jgi:hypothetical protein
MIRRLLVTFLFWPLLAITAGAFVFGIGLLVTGEIVKSIAVFSGLLLFMEIFNPHKV